MKRYITSAYNKFLCPESGKRINNRQRGKKQMDNKELYQLLGMPEVVKERLLFYENSRIISISDNLFNRLMHRNEWDEAVKDLQELLGEDPDGIKILWELLNLACIYTYPKYLECNISEDIFVDTMKFCTRFLNEHFSYFGSYKFVWAWWFPRQISFNEFRIGALEYEFVDGENREIAIHIPSDADMSIESVLKSMEDFYLFRQTYFPQWDNIQLTCDSWMLMPQLSELLGDGSNIVTFQKLFKIDSIDYDATWYMGWIYPGFELINDSLPEGTTLQRRLKNYLLEGKKFGIAKGHLIYKS